LQTIFVCISGQSFAIQMLSYDSWSLPVVVVPAAVLHFVVFKVHCSKCLPKPQDQDWSSTQQPTHLATHPRTPGHPSVVDQPWARGFSLAAQRWTFFASKSNEMEWNEMNCSLSLIVSGFCLFFNFLLICRPGSRLRCFWPTGIQMLWKYVWYFCEQWDERYMASLK